MLDLHKIYSKKAFLISMLLMAVSVHAENVHEKHSFIMQSKNTGISYFTNQECSGEKISDSKEAKSTKLNADFYSVSVNSHGELKVKDNKVASGELCIQDNLRSLGQTYQFEAVATGKISHLNGVSYKFTAECQAEPYHAILGAVPGSCIANILRGDDVLAGRAISNSLYRENKTSNPTGSIWSITLILNN